MQLTAQTTPTESPLDIAEARARAKPSFFDKIEAIRQKKLADPNIPEVIKELFTTENVHRSVLEIDRMQLSPRLTYFIHRYEATLRELSSRSGGDSGIHVRDPILWRWCRLHIERITFHFRSNDAASNQARAARHDEITDWKTIILIFDVLLDDVADNLHDQPLFDVLAAIPTASGEFGIGSEKDFERLRIGLREIGRSDFVGYFDLACEVWNASIAALRELTGSGFDQLRTTLAHDYEWIVRSCQFSLSLNLRARELFHAGPLLLDQEFGRRQFIRILAHNQNRVAFFTIDLMNLCNTDPAGFDAIVASGAARAYRQIALISQEMLQMGNSVATAGREIGSDDISNDVFQLANELLNERTDWELPTRLAVILSGRKRDALLVAFELKRSAKQERNRRPMGTLEWETAQAEYLLLGEELRALLRLSGAERRYLEIWPLRRAEISAAIPANDQFVDWKTLQHGDDTILVTHLVLAGRM